MRSQSTERTSTRRMVALALVCVLMVAGGQAAFDRSMATVDIEAPTATIGRAGFAYLTGFRVYAAAVLWNRLEPIMHTYYSDTAVSKMTYMIPTIRVVVELNPQLVDAYYVGAWIIASNGLVDEGVDLAQQGVVANPQSGFLRVNYAQILQLWADDITGAYEQSVIAMEDPDITWTDDFEKHDAYAIIGSIMRVAGDDERAALADAEIERLDTVLGDALPPGSHDHDGDGVPDH